MASREIKELEDNMILLIYTIDQGDKKPLTHRVWMHKDSLKEYDEGWKKINEEMNKLEYKLLYGEDEGNK